MQKAYVIGSGMAVAKNEVTNDDLCNMFPMLATSDEWLRKNVGIRRRFLSDENESLVDLLARAAKDAIEESGVTKIDRLIVGSNTQPNHYPATASKVAQRLKETVDLTSCWCLDIQNGCPGGLVAMSLGVDAVRLGQAENVLALGGDQTSRMVDWFNRNTSLLLGDAASAFVISGEQNAAKGGVCLEVLSHWEETDFESSDIMSMESGTSDYSPFAISERTREAAKKAVLEVTGKETLDPQTAKEFEAELEERIDDLRKLAFPPDGKGPYRDGRNPYFVMLGAEVLEKIRRIVPDCGYLPVLRKAGVGLDLFEKYGLLETNRVSEIPSSVKKEFLQQLSERFDLLIPHQANMRGHQNLSAAFRIPMNKLYSNISEYANTSGGATGVALYEALRMPTRYRTIRGDRKDIETPKLEVGQQAVLVSFGSGTHVSFVVVKRLK